MTPIADMDASSVKLASQATLGSQVVMDLYECETAHLDDLPWVKATLVDAALAAGATVVQTVFHKFAPWGISGVVVISESHLAVHIWPENRYAAIDVFTCGEKVQLHVAIAVLKRKFRSKRTMLRRFSRGDHAISSSGKSPNPEAHRNHAAALVAT